MDEIKLGDKVRTNSAMISDISLKVAGIRGLLFRKKDLECCEDVQEKPGDIDEEIEYQTVLLKEIMCDLEEIERRL